MGKMLIDVAEAKDYVQANYQGDPLIRHMFVTLLDKLPKIAPEDAVAQGEWEIAETIPSYEKAVRCSACGCRTYYPLARWNDVRFTKFCPDCGAKMKGRSHET